MVKEISVGYSWNTEWRKLFPVYTKCNTNVELRKTEKKLSRPINGK